MRAPTTLDGPRIPNLVPLARVTATLPTHWQTVYGYTPVLFETFVETGRLTDASYRAANWLHVGQTQGRGKLDRTHRNTLPVEDGDGGGRARALT